MSAKPWFKFYPSDWQADPALRSCSAAARGVWLEMLLLMDRGQPRGNLCLPDGRMIGEPMLALLIAVPADELRGHLAELRRANVFSTTAEGVIFSRKMVRDEVRSRKSRENGKTGGNPALTGKVVPIRAGLSQDLTGWDNTHWHLASGLSKKEQPTYQGKALGDRDPFGGAA